jgi:hypothetical protein
VQLDRGILAGHFRARHARHVIGLHSTSPGNTSRWAAVDVDAHEGGNADPAANLRAALAWYGQLTGLGFRPLLSDSNSRGGFHLLTLFSEPVTTPRVFAFLKWLTDDYHDFGLTARPETFPKQPSIGPGQYGNWLRVVGKHPRHEHWSRAWSGSAWLEGHAAIDHLLSLTGDPPSLIPAGIQPIQPRPFPPPPQRSYPATGDALGRRVAAYVARLPRLSAGEGRHKVAFGLAAWLVRDLQLPDVQALAWLGAWDQGNVSPLGEDGLRDVLRCAREYGRHPAGCGLGVARRPRRQGQRRQHHPVTVLEFTVRGGD